MNPFTFNFVLPIWISDLTDFRIRWISWCQGLWKHTDNAFKEVLSSEDDHKHVSLPKGHTQK